MRLLLAVLALLFGGCTAWDRSTGQTSYSTPLLLPKPKPASDADPIGHDTPERIPATPAAPPPAPQGTPQLLRTTSQGVSLSLLPFDSRSHTLVVIDKLDGPDSSWTSSKEAATSHRALAAINGGFFTPEGDPLGLVIAGGSRRGTWTRASSLTSGVLAVKSGRPLLTRSAAWSANRSAEQLIQGGPFLLERATVVGGLSHRDQRARSFVAWDGGTRWVLGHARSATLQELARALAAQPLSGVTLQSALNLDGGRSSDLWVGSEVKGGPLSTRQFWNKPVRNYLLLVEGTTPPSR